MKDILNYLEKFAAEVKAFFDSKEASFFSSFWIQPDNNQVVPVEENHVEPVKNLGLTAQ